MAYAHHSPVPSFAAQPGQAFDPQTYAHQAQQYQQYRPSPTPSPRPSPQPSPQPYAYQQVNRPPPSPQYNQSFAFPPGSPHPPIQQSYRPPPSPQPIFPVPHGYTPPTHIPPSLQARVRTPAPPEQTTASPRPHYAYLPQQNVITSVPTSSPPRTASPSRPLPPPQRTRPESVPPISRIQLPTSSFTENTLYRQPSAVTVSPTRSPIIPSPGPGPSVSPQPPVQDLVHRPSYSTGSASPPKPMSSFGPPVLPQMSGQVPNHMPGQIPSHMFGQIPGQLPSQRSDSPNRGRPLPTPTSRTPSPTKSMQPPVASRSMTDNTPQRQLQQQQPQQPQPLTTRSVTGAGQPSQSPLQSALPGPIHRPTSSMSTISTSSRTSSIKEIALPPPTTPGQPFVPYWKRNLQGGPREHGVQRRGTIAEGPSSTSAAIDTPRSNPSSFSSSNPPTSSFPTNPPSRSETTPGAGSPQKPANSFGFGARNPPGPQTEPRPRTNGTADSRDFRSTPGATTQQSPTRSAPSQTSSAFSLHQRRAAEIGQSNAGPDPEPRSEPRPNSNTQPQPPIQINNSRFSNNPSSTPTSGSGFSDRSTVPPKPVRSQTYDPKPFTRGKDSSDSTTSQYRGPPSPSKLSSGERGGQPPARTPSPQHGILDMPRSSFSQRVEAKTGVLNGTRSRDPSPVRSESPTRGIPSVSPFARGESPTRNPSPTRSRALPRPTPTTSNSPPTGTSTFPPALKRSSVTPQSVTLQMATMGMGENRDRGRPLDQHQVQRSSSPPKPQQERVQQNEITRSESGWPSNLPRLPRTPATSQHPNTPANPVSGTHGMTSPFSPRNRAGPPSRSSTTTSSSDRKPAHQNASPPNHAGSAFGPREDGRRSVVDVDLDDAPPPSLRRTPSPASSVASSNFSSFSAAMESYRNGASGSGFSASSRDPHQRTGSVPVRQSTEPAKTGSRHSQSQSQSQPRAGSRQQTFPTQPQIQSQPQVRQQQQQPPSPSRRRQPASPTVPSINVNTAPAHQHQPRSPTVPTIRTPQAQSPQRQKISFPANPDSDSDGETNGPRIAVSVVDDSGPGPRISVSGSNDVPSISINVGGADDDHGNGPAINVDSGGPSVSVNGGRRSVAELPTIRRGGGLSCGGCGGMIVGRVVSAMGARWHPGCFRCCVCTELLENLSSYEKDGRSFCHLDYHEVGPFCVPFARLG